MQQLSTQNDMKHDDCAEERPPFSFDETCANFVARIHYLGELLSILEIQVRQISKRDDAEAGCVEPTFTARHKVEAQMHELADMLEIRIAKLLDIVDAIEF